MEFGPSSRFTLQSPPGPPCPVLCPNGSIEPSLLSPPCTTQLGGPGVHHIPLQDKRIWLQQDVPLKMSFLSVSELGLVQVHWKTKFPKAELVLCYHFPLEINECKWPNSGISHQLLGPTLSSPGGEALRDAATAPWGHTGTRRDGAVHSHARERIFCDIHLTHH